MLLLAFASCQKEDDLKPSGESDAFKKVHNAISGKFLTIGDSELKVTADKIEFKTPEGERHSFPVDSTSGKYAIPTPQPTAEYFGGDYYMEIRLIDEPTNEIFATAYLNDKKIFASFFYY